MKNYTLEIDAPHASESVTYDKYSELVERLNKFLNSTEANIDSQDECITLLISFKKV